MNPVVEVERSPATSSESPAFPHWIRISFWLCILIAVAAVVRRVIALAHPSQSGPPEVVALDAVFSAHTALTLAHIIPALSFVLLVPSIYLRGLVNKIWVERVLFPLGLMIGITAYLMSSDPVGGWLERSAVLFFNTLFLYCLWRAWQLRRGERASYLCWLTRAIGVLLGIATTRPVMGIFFATSALTKLTPRQFFGAAFWIGFSINTLAVELWLRSRAGGIQMKKLALLQF